MNEHSRALHRYLLDAFRASSARTTMLPSISRTATPELHVVPRISRADRGRLDTLDRAAGAYASAREVIVEVDVRAPAHISRVRQLEGTPSTRRPGTTASTRSTSS
jgi:hypothetical protein